MDSEKKPRKQRKRRESKTTMPQNIKDNIFIPKK
jgi:hypothetical protein